MIDGFVRRDVPEGELWAAEAFADAALEAGLDRQERWDALLAAGEDRGRGRIAAIDTADGPVVLKQLLRGGLAGPLWGQRFPSRRRLLDNLAIPTKARAKRVPTPEVPALLLVSAGPSLWRGWLAVREVAGAASLSDKVAAGPIHPGEWMRALAAVRLLHDAGIEHRDLNLGNLLFDASGDAWIIDLDGCREHAGPLEIDTRIDGIRRVERSYHKVCFLNGLEPDGQVHWMRHYSGHDCSLVDRWNERSERDLARLRRHRAGWRRPPL